MLRSPSVEIESNPIEIRPAAREDQARIQPLVRGLTPRTRYLRFFNGVQELAQPWLERFSQADPQGNYTLLALLPGNGAAVGMAQFCADPYPSRADLAVLVADRWQGLGFGRGLVSRLLFVARTCGLQRMEGQVLSENRAMLRLLQRIGFRLRRMPNFSCNAALVL